MTRLNDKIKEDDLRWEKYLRVLKDKMIIWSIIDEVLVQFTCFIHVRLMCPKLHFCGLVIYNCYKSGVLRWSYFLVEQSIHIYATISQNTTVMVKICYIRNSKFVKHCALLMQHNKVLNDREHGILYVAL